MNDKGKTKEQLINELAEMRQRIAGLEALEIQRKHMEEVAIESEGYYQRLIELSPEAIAVHSQGKIVFINAAGAKLLGVASPEELIGKSIMNFVHPDYQKIIKKRVRQAFEQGKTAPLIEEKLVRPDGTVIFVETTATSITYQGKPAMLAVSRDITERKKMEEALKNSARRWHTTFDAIGDAVSLLDLEGRILRCNKAMADLLGKPFSEILGRTCWELIHTALGPVERRRFMRMQKRHRRQTMVLPIGDRYFNITVDPLLNKDGNLMGAVHIMADITERKKIEEALRKSEGRLRKVFETMAEGIVLIAPDGQIVQANSAAERILGLTRSEIEVRNYVGPDWEILRPDRTPMPPEEMAGPRAMKEKRLVKNIVMGARRPDGSIRWINVSAAPLINQSGELEAVVGTFADITERKKAEEKIKTYQKRLQALASELTLTEEREKRHLATELHDSISQLLALCRIKLGELEKATRFSDSRSLVKEIEERLEEIIWHSRSLTLRLGPPVLYELGLKAALEWLAEYMQEQYGIQTKFKVDGEAEPVDEELRVFLFRTVQELMMNVAKHAETDKAKVSVWRENDRMHITVEDRGVGFNTAIIDGLSGKDSGFGLFSIREHIKYFGGELSIQSKPGEGTQVILTVPLKALPGKK